MPKHMVELLERGLSKTGISTENAKICLLGLAFLENSDDTRNTPSLQLYLLLKEKNANVIIHDPFVTEFDGVKLTQDLNEAITDADAIMIVTPHKQYYDIQLTELKDKMRNHIIIDGRNIFNGNECKEQGFTYLGVGKGQMEDNDDRNMKSV